MTSLCKMWTSSFTWQQGHHRWRQCKGDQHENQQSQPSLRNVEAHLEDHKS
ncbi:hypothetical protein DPMN_111534 [Dreissena polymorpha]|uniref:Uncharacterized protein n=1 Tax=Dreissena polymorpha TaxID=45954 RepID=A0A9D4KEN0_DREPO|nr:hypothetical protein DPMN_111534 [Dreissena polymorpha]